MKKYLIVVLIVFLSFNVFLIYSNNTIKIESYELQKKHQYNKLQVKYLRESINRSYYFINRPLLDEDGNLKECLSSYDHEIPFLYINYDGCSSCKDQLLIELEKLKEDSIKIVEDLVLIIGIGEKTPSDGEIFLLRKKFKDVVVTYKKSISIGDKTNLFNSFFVLVDNNFRVLLYLEYDVNRSSDFFNDMKIINETYRTI